MRRDARVQWAAASILGAAALGLGSIALSAPVLPVCEIPADPAELQPLADAAEITRRDSQKVRGQIDWIDASWDVSEDDQTRSHVRMLISYNHSDFLELPSSVLPQTRLPSDREDFVRREVSRGTLPIHFLVNDTRNIPNVQGWTFLFEGRPVEEPTAALLARAFEHPLSPPPPIGFIVADTYYGRASSDRRQAMVADKLTAVWSSWDAWCSR